MTPEMEGWARDFSTAFKTHLGLAARFALPCARLYIALWVAGLNPRITSGYRDGRVQAALRARWDAGDRQGIRVRPASTSKHSTTAGGHPASEAVDMPCDDDRKAALIAGQLGIGSGLSFSVPDPGHYYLLGGTL